MAAPWAEIGTRKRPRQRPHGHTKHGDLSLRATRNLRHLTTPCPRPEYMCSAVNIPRPRRVANRSLPSSVVPVPASYTPLHWQGKGPRSHPNVCLSTRSDIARIIEGSFSTMRERTVGKSMAYRRGKALVTSTRECMQIYVQASSHCRVMTGSGNRIQERTPIWPYRFSITDNSIHVSKLRSRKFGLPIDSTCSPDRSEANQASASFSMVDRVGEHTLSDLTHSLSKSRARV